MRESRWRSLGGNILDKYIVKMFSQAYHDLDKIYEQIALNSNYTDEALALVEKIEEAIFSLEEYLLRSAERKQGFYAYKGYRQLFVSGYIIVYEVLEKEKVVAVVTVKFSGSEF